MKRLAIATILLPGTLIAQEGPLGWAELLAPDRVAQQLIQTGIVALRSQVDLTYSALAVDLRAGTATLTDVSLRPPLDHADAEDCRIAADRLVLRTGGFARPDRLRARIEAGGVTVPLTCLPPPARVLPETMDLGPLFVPRLAVDLDYDLPSASADATLFAQIDGVAAIEASADFAYVSVRDGSDDPEAEPDLVADLSSGSIRIENLGGWDMARQFLPPAFADDATGAATLGAVLRQGLTELNAGAPLNAAQQDFADSVTAIWPQFLDDPRSMVVETGFDPAESRRLDFAAYERDPRRAFDDLEPLADLAPRQARAAIPADLLRQALGDGAAALSPEDRLRVGRALATGTGAPRNLAAAIALLSGPEAGTDGETALLLAEALAKEDAAAAYRRALDAGTLGADGAPTLLDRIEADLSFARILDLQRDGAEPPAAPETLAQIRDAAADALSGSGARRDYERALYWATLGAAAGDGESRGLLDAVEARAARADEAGRAAWDEARARAARDALDNWLSRDLPARFGAR
ncbi:fructose-bisphosphate aldolase [Oceaniovalibus guishaninsula JLT2003]|uniref:Fructose-bisphosphate aldolase n=1 Tax=Oceaniovalibus guishaninsula JLT2003 TaxID=1231392 RepID=K2I7M7_9RHOB|nr:hypothetical protein [Oceaniovalibus guishaninsula]EKE45020.1 fructose-bisphosphate aldolase [Oceaniovalibus guishaninsula JLT2003]